MEASGVSTHCQQPNSPEATAAGMLDVRATPTAFHEPALCMSLSTGALCCCTSGREVGAPVEPSDNLAPAQEGRDSSCNVGDYDGGA